MAALKDIKRKITAVQKTRQITRAMNMVAASKFKSAQTRMDNFRHYAVKFMEVLGHIARQADAESHPLLALREPRRLRIVCMTSDRGLCGGFNNNLIRTAERFMKKQRDEGRQVSLTPIGRKARDFFRKKETLVDARADVFARFDMNLAVQIAEDLIGPFVNEAYDELYLIYNEFVSVAVHRPTVVRLFPLTAIAGSRESDPGTGPDTIYEPSAGALLEKLLPMYVHILIYRALVETSAGENGARMAAMDNATRNCEEMIHSLTLKYNKVRQSAITAELMDIVGGTEALAKG
ncbi:MAG: ATP synthase F1 subunit gamma [Thermodesulfobacteriota bacterium]